MRTLKDLLNAKRVILYGAGNQYRYCYNYLRSITDIPFFTTDTNKAKWFQKTCFNETIIPPEELLGDLTDTHIVITSVANQYEIAIMLRDVYGVSEEELYMYTSSWYEEKVFLPEEIEKHWDQIETISMKLADNESQRYYLNSIKARQERNPLLLVPNVNSLQGEYRNEVCLTAGDHVVDCGAYIGDTASYYIKKLNGDCLIFAIEPFIDNYRLLVRHIDEMNWQDIVKPYNCAVGIECRSAELLYNEDDFSMAMNLGKSTGNKRQSLDVKTLDSLFKSEDIDFIKMDIEGEENNALLGGVGLIKRCHPRMMISAYHKITDFWDIPITIWRLFDEYNIFVSHAPGVSTEMEYYCIEKEVRDEL